MPSFWFSDKNAPKYVCYTLTRLHPKTGYYDPAKADLEEARSKKGKALPRQPATEDAHWDWCDYWNGERSDNRSQAEYDAWIEAGKPPHTAWVVNYPKTDLQQVDELICEFMCEPAPDLKFDSMWYNACHQVGFATLYNLGGFEIGDKPEHMPYLHEKFDMILNDMVKGEYAHTVTEGFRARVHALVDWVFTQKWTFGAAG